MLAGQWQWGGMELAAEVGAGSSSGSMGRSSYMKVRYFRLDAGVVELRGQ